MSRRKRKVKHLIFSNTSENNVLLFGKTNLHLSLHMFQKEASQKHKGNTCLLNEHCPRKILFHSFKHYAKSLMHFPVWRIYHTVVGRPVFQTFVPPMTVSHLKIIGRTFFVVQQFLYLFRCGNTWLVNSVRQSFINLFNFVMLIYVVCHLSKMMMLMMMMIIHVNLTHTHNKPISSRPYIICLLKWIPCHYLIARPQVAELEGLHTWMLK
jgi:hypothetical protein